MGKVTIGQCDLKWPKKTMYNKLCNLGFAGSSK